MSINFSTGGSQHFPMKAGINYDQVVKTATWSTDSDSFVDVSDFSVTITPTLASSRMLIVARIMAAPSMYVGFLRILRGSTDFYNGTASGNRSGVSLQCFMNPGDVAHGPMNLVQTQVYIDHPNTTSSGRLPSVPMAIRSTNI